MLLDCLGHGLARQLGCAMACHLVIRPALLALPAQGQPCSHAFLALAAAVSRPLGLQPEYANAPYAMLSLRAIDGAYAQTRRKPLVYIRLKDRVGHRRAGQYLGANGQVKANALSINHQAFLVARAFALRG